MVALLLQTIEVARVLLHKSFTMCGKVSLAYVRPIFFFQRFIVRKSERETRRSINLLSGIHFYEADEKHAHFIGTEKERKREIKFEWNNKAIAFNYCRNSH